MRRVTVALLAAHLVWLGTGIGASSEQANNIVVPVRLHQEAIVTFPVGGSVAAHKSVILSAQLPGRVVMIAGEEGDYFSSGTVLLKLNDEELLAQRRSAEAQWASANAAYHNAAVQYSRMVMSPAASSQAPGGMGLPGMFDQMFTNPMAGFMGTRRPGVERGADIYASGTQIDQARHALEQARSRIRQIDTKLRDTVSVAPFDGVIVKKYVEVGDTVQPGQPLLGYEDVQLLQIVADIPTRLVSTLREGDTVIARIDAINASMNVQVANIFPKADPIKHTIRVKFNLPQDVIVAAGTYAEVRIPTTSAVTETQITVPVTAVVQRGGLPVVFVVDKENRIEMRLVRLGETLPSGEVVIHFGVTENEMILDRPASYITSGYRLPQKTD